MQQNLLAFPIFVVPSSFFCLLFFSSFRSHPNVHYLREEPTSPPQEPLSLVRQMKRLFIIGQAKQNFTGHKKTQTGFNLFKKTEVFSNIFFSRIREKEDLP
jgi:hypothetical protein